jgi:hypothetical protein
VTPARRKAPRVPRPKDVVADARFTKARAEIKAVERLVGPHGLRSWPWFTLCRDFIASGKASQVVAAAERSRREWEAVRDACRRGHPTATSRSRRRPSGGRHEARPGDARTGAPSSILTFASASAAGRRRCAAVDPAGADLVRPEDVETPTVRPHVATWPSDGPHVEPRTTSEILLLMDLMSSVKAGTRQVLYEPLASPSLCARCEAAYAAARRTVELAGGIEAWSRQLGRTLKVDKLEPAKKESRAREQDAAALAKRFGEPMSRVLGWIGMDWRMDGGTWEQARDRVARRLGRQAAGARRRAGP